MDTTISSKFPFDSKFIEINGSDMHYVDVGKGDTILFLHGQPTSSYLWRNIIPHLQTGARCIAPDLIGMGKSGKPDIAYTFEDHYDYLLKFIEKLGLKNITLVIHDWGSGLGFHYANTHRDNIKGIAFMEAIIKPMDWKDFPSDYKIMFKLLRAPFIGWLMLSVANMFLKKVVPDSIVRKLSKEEYDNYLKPYPTVSSRKPVRAWPQQLPISGKPKHMHEIIDNYNKWLTTSDIPKICLYAHPGAIITKKQVEYIGNKFPNTKLVDIGKGRHYLQEDQPHTIGKEIAKWVNEI
jgi:haloalkane dehalogenase